MQRLHRFLAVKNIAATTRAIKSVRQGVKVLGYQTGIGRTFEDIPEEFREWLIDFGNSGYVARYRFDGETVTILAVRHQKEAGYH